MPDGVEESGSTDATSVRSIVWGLGAIGGLIGLTAGYSTAELTLPFMALVFALVGGSVVTLLGKLDRSGQATAGAALTSFGLAAALALTFGLFVRVNGLLSLAEAVNPPPDLLRSDEASLARLCYQMIATGELELPSGPGEE